MANAPRKKLHLSSSAFAWGSVVFTDSKAGCVRSILLSNHGVREGEIDRTHIVRGALNEAAYEATLKAQGTEYQREVSIRHEVAGYPGVELSGRMDFLRTDGGVSVIDELKSTESKNVISSVINKGKPKETHLAQIVAYMVLKQISKGNLIYTAYKNNCDGTRPVTEADYEKIKERAFEIFIDDAGRVCVDSMPSGFTVGDLYAHQKLVAQHLQDNTVGERPKDAHAAFGSPCHFCPWKAACDAYDSGAIESTTDSFVSYAKQLSKGEKQ